jgi:basic membrane lipoprotein Med (substrate-binding protein (PBP1-ABC) superfamily)
LHSYVSRLRTVLGPGRIETRAPGYVLAADASELDAADFERRLTVGREALAAGDPMVASAELGAALALWRGSPLADVAADLHLSGEIARLEELRTHALESWADAELAVGRHERLLPELERLTTSMPLREPLWGHRMLALHRSGRSADALRAYEELRRTLADELGVDPSAELRRLHERILLQDPRLQLPSGKGVRPPGTERNPYKGLRAFTVEDADDFFGREELVRDLVEVLGEPGRRLVSVVGPSGSGKSSVVRAGLLPALRRGAVPGSARWRTVTLLPGPDPFASLTGAVDDVAPTVELAAEAAPMRDGGTDDLRWISERLGPSLLVIDQFEELFTLADPDVCRRFLDALTCALTDADGELRAVVTLRADFFDRPLAHPTFGRLFTAGLVPVHPLTAAQLEAAVVGPARVAGVDVDPALVAVMVADLAGQPGALPLFQYALTELFERRRDGGLTPDGYRAIGGVDGALTRRAEQLFSRFDPREQEAVRQLFLRLVRPAAHVDDARRRTPIGEVAELEVDPLAMQTALDRYGRARLLTFDRDSATGAATVEVSHEALLRTWSRLGTWVEEASKDLRRRAALTAAVSEWAEADEDPDYLLVGARLERYADWAARSSLRLTGRERRFLDRSLERRELERAAEQALRLAAEDLRRQTARRRWGLGAVTVGLVGLLLVTSNGGPDPVPPAPELPRVVLLLADQSDESGIDALMASGLDSAQRAFDVETDVRSPLVDVEGYVRRLCETGTDLIILGGGGYYDGILAAGDCPDAMLVAIDAFPFPPEPPPNVVPVVFSVEEGSFLAGVVAAERTTSGVVGFLGGAQWRHIDEFRAGFEAGVAAAGPEVEVVATHVTHRADLEHASEAYGNPGLGRVAAVELFDRGADVVYAVAGRSGDGALEEAATRSADRGEPHWVIGVDTDWQLTQPEALRPYVLTSMTKRLDIAIEDVVGSFVAGTLTGEERRYGLAEGGVDYVRTGGRIEPMIPVLERYRDAIAAGEFDVPRIPRGDTLPPATATVGAEATVTYSGSGCSYEGPRSIEEGTVLRITTINDSDGRLTLSVWQVEEAPPIGPDSVDLDLDDEPGWLDLGAGSHLNVPAGDEATIHVGASRGTTEVTCADFDEGVGYRVVHLRTAPPDGG